MGEHLPPLPTAPELNGVPNIVDSNRHTSPIPSENVVTTPLVSSSPRVNPQPGRGHAIFSTDLGSRAPRASEDPSFVRCIARSDMVMDVVVGARNLLRKYPYQYLNIFPQQGWQIGDLWDGHDIQVEGDNYFKEVLGFIERDNVVRSQIFACEWAYKNPERQYLIGGDMTGLYDKTNPLSIIDKLFVNGESQDYPPVFLWKVAHFLRASMIAVMGPQKPPKEAVKISERPAVNHKDSVVCGNMGAPAPANTTTSVAVATRTTAKALTPVVNPAVIALDTHSSLASRQDRQASRITDSAQAHARLTPPVGHVGGAGCAEPMGHIFPVLPAHQAGVPHVARHGLCNPRTRPGRSASGSQNQISTASPYTENLTHVSSGHGARQQAGPMPMPQSPRFNQAHVPLNHPMGNVPPGLVPFGYDQGPMGPGMVAGQSYPSGVMHPGSMPPHAMHGTPMAHGFPRQPSNTQILPFATPMGDLTNVQYGGPPVMPMHNIESRHPQDHRFSQQHVNSNALYDPYEGSNPAFRNTGYPSSKKYNPNSLQHFNVRQRKPSCPGSRPYFGQYPNGRPHAGGLHPPGPKPFSEDDRAITQDRDFGCYVDWIGSRNETVNELFVKDLPEDVQGTELEVMFQDRLGVKPTSVNIRFSPYFPQQTQARRHAFVGFSNTSIAKQALVIHSPTIRGLPISITVPKRFFQKTLDVLPRVMTEAGPSAYSRFTSNPNNREARNSNLSLQEGSKVPISAAAMKEKMSYSPQDARSDLNKKKKGKQAQQAQAAAGSPEAAKAKPETLQKSLTKEESAAPTTTVKANALHFSAGSDAPESAPDAVQKTTHVLSTQTEQPLASDSAPSAIVREDVARLNGTQSATLKPGADSHAPETLSNELSQAIPQYANPEPRTCKVLGEEPDRPQVAEEDVVAKPGPFHSIESEEPTSDDELKNEASFHSAAESQSDLNPKVDPTTGSDIKNHGTIISVMMASATMTNSAADTNGNANIVRSGDAAVPALTTDKTPNAHSKPAIIPPADSNATVVPAATQQEEKTPASMTVVVGQAKKSGPQQTEPLGPYPSRAQREAQAKKGREQKKKALKKEKELAQKAKAEKAAAKKAQAEHATAVKANSTDSLTEVDVTSAGTESQDVEELQPLVRKPTPSPISRRTTRDSRAPGKRRGEIAVTATAKDIAPVKIESEDHGKQANGTSILNETGSVTNKDATTVMQETAQEGPQECAQKVSKEHAPTPAARSSEQEDTEETSSGVPEPSPAMASADAPTPSGKKRNKKKKKSSTVAEGQGESSRSAPSWPDLEFRPRSPNPVWMGPIDMEQDVQNYETIMDKACGVSDDSDFSWSDLPTMEDVPGLDEGEAQANSVHDSEFRVTFDTKDAEEIRTYTRALFPKIKKLQPNMAGEIMARLINNSTVKEMAQLVTDNPALVAKVDEIVLFHQEHKATASIGSQSLANKLSIIGREETVDRGIATLEARIGQHSVKPFADASLTFAAGKKEERDAADSQLAVHKVQLRERSTTQESSSANDGRIATPTNQLAATRAETAAAQVDIAVLEEEHAGCAIEQDLSNLVSQGSQPAKKKKANKHRNKKKKKSTEDGEISQPGETTGTTSSADSAQSKDEATSVDAKDPFAHQLKEVSSVIMQSHDECAYTKAPVQLRGGAATPTNEPVLMRDMEAYFREAHPERGSRGRKILRQDLR